MDFGDIPPWCLCNVITKLEPSDIENLGNTNSKMKEVCASQTLWSKMYHKKYPPSSFHLTTKDDKIDWVSRFQKRYSIPTNISTHKPRVKSFTGNNISRMRSLANAFAFSTEDKIYVVAYDYFDKLCEYENIKTFDIACDDFLLLDSHSIVAVSSDFISLLNIDTGNRIEFPKPIGKKPMIHNISSDLFAVVSNDKGVVYDVHDNLDPKCIFRHIGAPIALASNGSTLYIATATDLSAHDVRNPRGPILWNRTYSSPSGAKFCSFNFDVMMAFYGDMVVNLTKGRIVVTQVAENVTCGSVINAGLCVAGLGREALFFDIKRARAAATHFFGEEESIRSLHASVLNERVAIAGDYTVRILHAVLDADGGASVDEVRTVKAGSVGLRRSGEIGAVREVLFDGERLVTNMGSFVRVYDFYGR